MLPLVDRPVIQYAVEQAAEAERKPRLPLPRAPMTVIPAKAGTYPYAPLPAREAGSHRRRNCNWR